MTTTAGAQSYRARHAALGLCLWCSSARTPGSVLCLKHLRLLRTRSRRSMGSKPWRAGKPGRPPLVGT